MRQTRTGQSRITVDELGDQDAILVTITGASVKSFSNDYLKGGDEKVVLAFDRDFPGAEYVLNATSFRSLVDRYGNDKENGFAKWIGQPCVLVRASTTDPRTGDKVESVWVATRAQWAEVMEALREQESAEEAAKPARKRSVARGATAKKRK